jgi:hypothetical protein
MDGDDSEQNQKIKRQKHEINFLQRYISNVSDVLSTSWIRCTVQDDDGSDRFVLGSRRYLLLNFRMFLVILYITYETFK